MIGNGLPCSWMRRYLADALQHACLIRAPGTATCHHQAERIFHGSGFWHWLDSLQMVGPG